LPVEAPYHRGVKRRWRQAFNVSVALAGLGGLLWRTGSARRSTCRLPDALGKRFVPALYAQCQQSHHNVAVGVVLLGVGLLGAVITFASARADLRWWRAHVRTMPVPTGWMRVPVGWRPMPASGPFMPVPPGWPQPAADWVAPPGWMPPQTWPDPPKGWPRPDLRSPAEIRRQMASARAIDVIGLVVFALEVVDPLPLHGPGAVILLAPFVIALICLINLVLSFRSLRVFPPFEAAYVVGIWSCLYATIDDVGDARLSALVLAAVVFALAFLLRKQRLSAATLFPKNLWLEQPVTPPPPTGNKAAQSSDG
jgi:hypothetical protein